MFNVDDPYEAGFLGQLLRENDTIKIKTEYAVEILSHCKKNHPLVYNEVMDDFKFSVSRQARRMLNILKLMSPYRELL